MIVDSATYLVLDQINSHVTDMK